MYTVTYLCYVSEYPNSVRYLIYMKNKQYYDYMLGSHFYLNLIRCMYICLCTNAKYYFPANWLDMLDMIPKSDTGGATNNF